MIRFCGRVTYYVVSCDLVKLRYSGHNVFYGLHAGALGLMALQNYLSVEPFATSVAGVVPIVVQTVKLS